ncbi:MAG: hypothetical protein DRI88_02095 [Bacteroidetes bacterium]|nr:MAG: hypothetical protein DRI72_00470 [Bacteroidota bacterium]RLD48834.1 MAG: hypothetical protein DRI88_02095 [Bacteroidota bacterium]RLD73552.1 MAG: hypothetical protein DRI87_03645 [Bacteroidota bacterium]RLD86717.1 MAG: hypothetical protein DRJ02_08130 [Bacteroidota bacterium]
MKSLTLVLSVIITALAWNLEAQVTQQRQLGEFTGIDQETFADIYISPGDITTVTVKADEDVIDRLITKVEDGVLKISSKGNFRMVKVFEVHITMSRIDLIKNSGSGDIKCTGGLPGKDVEININGSGDLDADLQVINLELKINGSGDVNLSGVKGDLQVIASGSGDLFADELQLENCRVSMTGSGDSKLSGSSVQLTVTQNGSGDLNARQLKAVDADIRNTGSGDCSVQAVNKLSASLNGSGDLYYYGAPEKVSVVANGSGEAHKR